MIHGEHLRAQREGSLDHPVRRPPWASARTVEQDEDRRVAERIGAELEAKTAQRISGLVDPRAELFAEHGNQPIAKHIVELENVLLARGRNRQHVSETKHAIERVVKQMGAQGLSDLSTSGVEGAVAVLRQEPKLVKAP